MGPPNTLWKAREAEVIHGLPQCLSSTLPRQSTQGALRQPGVPSVLGKWQGCAGSVGRTSSPGWEHPATVRWGGAH